MNALRRSISLQRHLPYSRQYPLLVLLTGFAFGSAVVTRDSCENERQNNATHHTQHNATHHHTQSERQMLYQYDMHFATTRRMPCKCENSSHDTVPSQPTDTKDTNTITPKPLSRMTLLLYSSYLYPYSYLRTPRLLTPRDPLFSYPELKRGLARRRNDEERVKQILSSPEVMKARKNNDQNAMKSILQEMNTVVYGKGITPQMREDFLMQYGCTGFTDDILDYLVRNYGARGLIDIGAGNGQWARALNDYYNKSQQSDDASNISKSWDFVLAYDNMEQLPLSPKIYHNKTLPAHKYFYDKVQRATHIDAVQNSRGRVLLLVYPPPGPMAFETVQAYLNSSPGYSGSYQNDTVVYVGEGRGGANADDKFFDLFLGGNNAIQHNEKDGTKKNQWVLEKVMNVHTCPGGKGYEKMFVFKRSSTS